jgi:hypothetical protein
MKYFNQIVFLSSFAMMNVCAMEIVKQDNPSVVCLDTKIVEAPYKTQFSYFSEYKPRYANNQVFFPVDSIDPLKIESCDNTNGQVKYFVTSHEVAGGKAFKIVDPNIKQLAVVRGRFLTGQVANVYIGFDADNVLENKESNKTILARLMALQVVQKIVGVVTDETYHHQSETTTPFDAREIESMVKTYTHENLLETCINSGNWKWESPMFQVFVEKMFGARAKDIDFTKKSFKSAECYWTEKENKLKAITY